MSWRSPIFPWIFLWISLGLLAAPAMAMAAPEPAGTIKQVDGMAWVERGGDRLPAAAGMALYPEDRLRAGENTTVSFFLRDNTLVTLGPNALLSLDRFEFDPAAGRFDLSLGMLKGKFSYLSGLMSKLAPEKVAVRTPTATIGIRGTKFLAVIE